MFPPSTSGTPFWRHWKPNGPSPSVETLKVAVGPESSVRAKGWVRETGGPILVSTNQPELFWYPPATKPLQRMAALVVRASPDNCQPPGMRVAAPKVSQPAPLVDTSKLVRQTSGPVPPRSQVMLTPSKARFWVAGPVLLSRPMLVRLCPPSVLNAPPTRIFPSACTAKE